MAFEGEPRVIPIKGISRAGADSLCEDGAMNEVIGLEYKYGSFVPYSGETNNKVNVQSEIKKIAVHKTSTQTNIIAVTDNALLWLPKEDFDTGSYVAIKQWNVLYDGKVKDIEFVKNIVIMPTINQVLYYRFAGDSYEAIPLNRVRELLPKVNLYVTNAKDIKVNNKSNGPILCVRNNKSAWTDAEIEIENVYRMGVDKLNELGRLHGYTLALYAYKLVSGEYVYASAPILLGPPNDAVGNFSMYPDLHSENKAYIFTTKYFGLYYDKWLSPVPEEVIEKEWENSEFATSDNVARLFKGDDDYAYFVENISATESMPSTWGYKFYYEVSDTSSSRFANIMLAFASNSLMCNIHEDIDASLDGLVESCCIFVSEQISPYNITSNTMHKGDDMKIHSSSGTSLGGSNVFGIYFDKRDYKDILDDIKDINKLYKVYEIPFNEIKKGVKQAKLEGKLGGNLPVQDVLPISAFADRMTFGGSCFVYNSRNHLYNYTEELYYPFDLSVTAVGGRVKEDGFEYGECQAYDEDDTIHKYRVIAEIDSAVDGKSKVVSDEFEIKGSFFNRYITYPNSNAKKISILCDNRYLKIFKLEPAKSGGYAYAISEGYGYYAKDTDNEVFDYNLFSKNILLAHANRMKVSDAYFAYTFPNDKVSIIGNGTIIKPAVLTTALSQDTFGQYPLLVFCTDGIYAMEVDTSGDGAYTNTSPFSREVCVNPNSICEIDGAVLFASNKGLMMATSQGVQEFVPNLNGEPKHKPDTKEIHGLGLELYGEVITNPQVTTLLNYVDISDFREYVADPNTVVTYASEKNKILIYNGKKPYVYWIDIPTRNATKLPVSIKMDNNDYPTELYVQSDNHMMEFKQLSANVNTQTMFQTRPIKLDGGMKTAMRVIVRGYFNSNEADKWAVLLVLGSYDGINWQPIGLKQKPLEGGFNDLGCVVDRVSHKYMMVIFSASLNRDSHIDGIELTKTNKYNNKLK